MLAAAAAVLTGTREVPVTYDVRSGLWVLLAPVRYYAPNAWVDLPAGFASDLASIPRIAWSVIAPHELGILPPLVHDWLYQHGGSTGRWRWTRAEADALFYWAMLDAGVAEWRARAAYTAVRAFGGRAWKG